MFFVYIIKSTRFDWYYVGSTSDLGRRLKKHNDGFVTSTKARRPYIIYYTESFNTVDEARKREKELKVRRTEKEKIIKSGPIV
jgi:putative endonuclease